MIEDPLKQTRPFAELIQQVTLLEATVPRSSSNNFSRVQVFNDELSMEDDQIKQKAKMLKRRIRQKMESGTGKQQQQGLRQTLKEYLQVSQRLQTKGYTLILNSSLIKDALLSKNTEEVRGLIQDLNSSRSNIQSPRSPRNLSHDIRNQAVDLTTTFKSQDRLRKLVQARGRAFIESVLTEQQLAEPPALKKLQFGNIASVQSRVRVEARSSTSHGNLADIFRKDLENSNTLFQQQQLGSYRTSQTPSFPVPSPRPSENCRRRLSKVPRSLNKGGQLNFQSSSLEWLPDLRQSLTQKQTDTLKSAIMNSESIIHKSSRLKVRLKSHLLDDLLSFTLTFSLPRRISALNVNLPNTRLPADIIVFPDRRPATSYRCVIQIRREATCKPQFIEVIIEEPEEEIIMKRIVLPTTLNKFTSFRELTASQFDRIYYQIKEYYEINRAFVLRRDYQSKQLQSLFADWSHVILDKGIGLAFDSEEGLCMIRVSSRQGSVRLECRTLDRQAGHQIANIIQWCLSQ